jgi:predicted phage terminase large subunit-like protein
MTNLPRSLDPVRRERALRRRIRTKLEAWARFALSAQGQAPARHHLALLSALAGLERGDTARLMLLLPPGSAKSTYASFIFPAWWMARNPGGAVISASHTAKLAERFGRGVRGLVDEHGARLNLAIRADARAAGHFMTEQGGEYFAIGVNGAVTGRRADLALIDDPIRSFAEAESGAARERLWNWYRTELLTRLKPRGRIVLATTRWHQDDLAGRLAEQEGWQVVRFPALAESDDPLGRAPGEALWPEWEPRDALLERQRSIGERGFAALYQQAPLASDGLLFNVAKLRIADTVPAGVCVRAWDLAAATSGDPDWTVGVKMVRDGNGGFWVDDVRRRRAAPDDVAELITDTARQDGDAVTIGLPQDPGQAGIFQTMTLTRLLAGFRVLSSPERGPKAERAGKVASQVAGGCVTLRRAPWNAAFMDELAAFPGGSKDDQVDAFSRAFAMLIPADEPARFASIPYLMR